MALDIGKVRVGVALSDITRTIASPHSTIRRTVKPEKCFDQILRVIQEKDVSKIAAGLPVTLLNTEELAARDTREFMDLLKEYLLKNSVHIPIEFIDERMTTAISERALIQADYSRKKRRGLIDQIAACEILKTCLAKNKNITGNS
jgi:putative Holliday junction resolvase